MAQFKVQRTFVFPRNADGKRYIEATNDSDYGFVAKWHTAQPSGIMFITTQAVSKRDLNKLEKLANKMGAQGTTSEQAVEVSPQQAKAVTARKERENARREVDQKDRQSKQDQEKQAATRKQQVTDREAKRETERETKDKEQAARAKRDAQIQKDAERRRAELTRSSDEREREQEAPPDEEGDSIEKTVATAVEKGVKAAMGKKDEKDDKKEKKEGVLSFGEFIREQPANFAGQGTDIAGLGGDEPIVRGTAKRRKDCRKVKGPCVPEPVILRRAGRVAESVMRQLKAASIANDALCEGVQVPVQEAYIAKKKENLDIFGYRFIIVFEAQDDIGAMLPKAKSRQGRAAKKMMTGLISGGDLKKEILARLKKHPRIEVLTDRKMRPRTISDAYYVDVQPAKEGERFKSEKEARDVLKQALKGLNVRGLTEAVDDIDEGVQVFPAEIRGKGSWNVEVSFSADDWKGPLLSAVRKEIKKAGWKSFDIREDKTIRVVVVAGRGNQVAKQAQKQVSDLVAKARKSIGVKEDMDAPEIPVEPTQPTTFAGSPIFKVDPDTFAKCCQGKAKWARWSKILNLEDEGYQSIRSFAYKNPRRPIVVQCCETGEMKFLRFNRTGGGGNRRKRKTALPPVDIQLDIEQNEAVNQGHKARIRAHGPRRQWPTERGSGVWDVLVQFQRSDYAGPVGSYFKKEAKKSGWKVFEDNTKRHMTVVIPARTSEEAAKKGDGLVEKAVGLDWDDQLKGNK